MDIWRWLLTICSSFLILIILLGILAYRWLRKHPELLVQGQGSRVAIPPGFETDFRRALQLEEQSQIDPRANLPLIQVYKLMLERLQPNEDPTLYATLQYNLGNAYLNLPTGDRAANLAQAISYFQQALRFYTSEAEPFACRRTTRNLAHLYFAQGAWDEALRAYRAAMDVGEQMYRVGLSTTSKTAEVSESAALYPHAAFAAVRCGMTAQAFLILERGKTRMLTEALRLRVRCPPQVPDEIWSAFEQAGTAVRA